MRRSFRGVGLLALAGLAGCYHPLPPAAPAVVPAAPVDPWVLTTLDANDATPALLWNGLVGFRIGRDGGGANQSFFSIEEYDTTGEEKIRAMKSPLPNGFLIDGKPLPVERQYRQFLDMRTSELTSEWKSGRLTVKCVTVLHPTKRVLAERWTLSGYTGSTPPEFDAGVAGQLTAESVLTKKVFIGPSKIRGLAQLNRPKGVIQEVDCVLTLGKSTNSNAMAMAMARPPGLEVFDGRDLDPPAAASFLEVEAEAKQVWADRWKTDIQIDGPVADQQAVRSFLYYLRSAVSPKGGMSISPFGLSHQMYNGHVFWDADTWVFPALALIDPEEAKAIEAYRINTEAKAHMNTPPAGFTPAVKSGRAIEYAWESSVTGKETAIGPSRSELHVSGDVARALDQAAALSLLSSRAAGTIVGQVGDFYAQVSHRGPDGELTIQKVMSPDENHTGDNDLYTSLLAQWTQNGGKYSGPAIYHLPRDDKSFLTYDGDLLKSYKQAAAVLSIYPLQYPPAEAQAKVMMDRFAGKVIKNGPAMSDSVHALIWARLGDTAKAYETWRQSWEPFTRAPLMLFSEKRNKAATYFTTGAAGSLQTVLFGFLGFRLDSKPEQGAAWSQKLMGNNWLSIKPNLPKEWKSVKLKNFSVLGHEYTLTATHRPSGPDAVQVNQGD